MKTKITNTEKIDKLLDKQLNVLGKDVALTILLNQNYNYKRSFLDENIIKVVKIICSEFNFTYDELVHSNDRSWQRVWSLKFCCYYMHNVKLVKAWAISYVLNRSKSLTYRYAKEVEETKDKIVIKFRNNFDKKIK
jgi:hypothetical protein